MNDPRDRPTEEGPGHLPAPYLTGHVAGHEYYYPGYPSGSAEPEGTDWGRIAGLLWQRRWWILGTVLLGTALGYAGSRFVEPVYETSATVWVEGAGTARGRAIRAGEVLAGPGWANIFQSYAVILPVVRQERLFLKPLDPRNPSPDLFSDFVVDRDPVPGVYEFKVDRSGRWTLSRPGEGLVEKGTAGNPVGLSAGFRWIPPAELARVGTTVRFRLVTPRQAAIDVWRAMRVRFDASSSLITVRLSWKDPQEAARIVNALSLKFIEVATDLKSRKMREEVRILEEQTNYVAQQLERAELALESHRIATITLPTESNATVMPGGVLGRDPVFGAYFERRLAASQLDHDAQLLEQLLGEIRAGSTPNLMSLRFVPSATGAPELTAAIEELQRKEVERRTLLYRYTEEWPDVQRLTEEARILKESTIPSLVEQIIGNLQNQRQTLDQQLQAQATELRQIPSRTIEQTRRQREAQLHAQLYNDLKVRLNNARLAEATAELADMQVVDEAVAPREPTQNQGPRIIILAAMASVGIGIAGVLVHDRLDRRIRHPDQVTGGLGLPVLGVVPLLNGKRGDAGATAAVAIEAFRGIRTQLARAGGNAGKVTLITSPAPREGKSMVAANLAISYAAAGYRTVLLDGDTRRGRAQEMFGARRSPGLADYLMERASLDQVLQETEVDGLWLIARGSLEDFNADRLDDEPMDELLSVLRESHDAVVIDGPPLAAGADALLLGERADKVLLVIRAGSTNEALARAKLEMVGNVELHIVGTVLNAVPESAPYYHQYVNYYYAEAELGS